MSAYTRQKAKSKYRNSTRFERVSQKQSSDTHKTPFDGVKRCRERKQTIKSSERVNVDVLTQNKRPLVAISDLVGNHLVFRQQHSEIGVSPARAGAGEQPPWPALPSGAYRKPIWSDAHTSPPAARFPRPGARLRPANWRQRVVRLFSPPPSRRFVYCRRSVRVSCRNFVFSQVTNEARWSAEREFRTHLCYDWFTAQAVLGGRPPKCWPHAVLFNSELKKGRMSTRRCGRRSLIPGVGAVVRPFSPFRVLLAARVSIRRGDGRRHAGDDALSYIGTNRNLSVQHWFMRLRNLVSAANDVLPHVGNLSHWTVCSAVYSAGHSSCTVRAIQATSCATSHVEETVTERKRGSVKGDLGTRIEYQFASTHKALNWRVVFPSSTRFCRSRAISGEGDIAAGVPPVEQQPWECVTGSDWLAVRGTLAANIPARAYIPPLHPLPAMQPQAACHRLDRRGTQLSRNTFTVTSDFSKALMTFHVRDIPPPLANKALPSLENYTKGTTHRILTPACYQQVLSLLEFRDVDEDCELRCSAWTFSRACKSTAWRHQLASEVPGPNSARTSLMFTLPNPETSISLPIRPSDFCDVADVDRRAGLYNLAPARRINATRCADLLLTRTIAQCKQDRDLMTLRVGLAPGVFHAFTRSFLPDHLVLCAGLCALSRDAVSSADFFSAAKRVLRSTLPDLTTPFSPAPLFAVRRFRQCARALRATETCFVASTNMQTTELAFSISVCDAAVH
ncbi:hypothetical protein PR048_018472 [Dryococelus australis]|uniref:Uncharacterized protein n=1 Tax=Dryococelus australis TaxID=614101 RepID=A0ABQ9HCJ0_9NEOP|nr:hypothetical protein PR048_018472 [Dryococelus australis]